MQEILKRYAEWIATHARAVLIACVLGTAVVASGMGRLVFNLDPEQQLPSDHPYILVDREIRREFGGQKVVAIALVPRSGTVWRADVLELVRQITDELLNAPGIIRQNVVSLSSPYVRVPEDRGGVLAVDYLMKEVPSDEAGIAALRDRYRREPLFKGTVVNDDERAALVLADFYDGVKAEEIVAVVESAVSKHRLSDVDVAVTGAPIFEDAERVLVQRQAYYFVATVVAILIVLWLAFGQMQGVLLPSMTAALSTILALGWMGFTGIPINAWTAAVPVMVVTVAAGHSAQMLKRYYEEFARVGDRRAAVVESTQRIGAVMMAAGATAGCGFAALSILGIPTLTHFGLGVAAGIFAAVVLEMTFMLALRVVWPSGRSGREGPLPRWTGIALAPIESLLRSHPRRVVVAFVAIAGLAAAGLPRLGTEVSARNYWSERVPAGRDLRVFETHFPSTTTLTILLEGDPGSMRTPQALQVMTGLQQAMAAVPGVGRTSSIADIIRRTYEVFAPEEAGNGLPANDTALVGQLFFLADSPAFERYVDRSYSRSVVLGFLNREDSALTRAVMQRLERYLEQHPPHGMRVLLAGGVAPTMLALNDHTVKGKMLNIAVVLAVIFFIASVLLRHPLGGALVTAPLLMSLAVNLGLFSWGGVAFDLSGASIVAIGVGIGADYAIYCLYRLREEFRRTGDLDRAIHTTMATTGRAIAFVALAISAGFGVYLISDFYAFRTLGTFVPLTMLTSCVTALALPPALVALLRPRFICGDRPASKKAMPGQILDLTSGVEARRAVPVRD